MTGTPDRDGQRATGALFAAAMGAAGGAALASGHSRRARIVAGLVGGAALAASDTVARAVQRPNEIPPLWSRIAASTALAAPLGRLFERATGGRLVAVGVLTGALAGTLGVRPQKAVLGPLVGFTVGRACVAGGRR